MSFFKAIYTNIVDNFGNINIQPSGEILLNKDPVSDFGVSTKQYVDNKFNPITRLVQNVTTVNTSTFTISSLTDVIISCKYSTTGVSTITLPLANSVSVGRTYIIVDTGGLANVNNITITSVDLINGDTEFLINQNDGSISLFTDGTNWFVH